ncbi:MAG: YciI family protein [Candidatus Methylomirabilales bacterium]
MLVYHATIATSDDYLERRAKHRQAHLDRIVGLRAKGLVVGGGPAPDGRMAEIFYQAQERSAVIRLVEEDPYYLARAWTTYTLRVFTEFIGPLELPPLVIDGSRRVTLVEGAALQVDKANLALIALRGAGRLGFGGFFEGGATLALLTTANAAEALGWLAETGFWKEGSFISRPFLYVL